MTDALKKAILDSLAEVRPQIEEDFWADFARAPEDELYDYHFGLGLHLRNHALTPGSELYRLFTAEGFTQKDDMSSLMLRVWHEALNN